MGDVMRDREGQYEYYDYDDYYDVEPIHKVTLSNFYMKAFCVTFEEYDAFCEATGREKPDDKGWGRGYRPVINVSWYDALEYCNWLSEKEGLQPVYSIDKYCENLYDSDKFDAFTWIDVFPDWSAKGYRLPTEAEWEYAAREGGKKVRFGNGQNILRPTEANFNSSERHKESYSEVGIYRGMTVPVDSFPPNALGLHNMSGNVLEWCWDRVDSGFRYYYKKPASNPEGPNNGSDRVVRGGCYNDGPESCRVAELGWGGVPTHGYNTCGFRIVFVP